MTPNANPSDMTHVVSLRPLQLPSLRAELTATTACLSEDALGQKPPDGVEERLVHTARLVAQVAEFDIESGLRHSEQSFSLAGDPELLASVVRGATGNAADDLHELVSAFHHSASSPGSENEVRAAFALVGAWVDTLFAAPWVYAANTRS